MTSAPAPQLSIAMAARNASRYLAQALHSVAHALSGSQIAYEILLADGSSTDDTIAIARSFPHVRIASTRDSGIYDGMNRAMSAASGEFVILLNSDDLFLPGGVARAVKALASAPDAAMISAEVLSGQTIDAATRCVHAGPISLEGLLFGIPAINARLFRVQALRRAGAIAAELGLGADREILMRLHRQGALGIPLAEPIYFYRSHEGSATIANDTAARKRIYASDETLINSLRTSPLYADAQTTLRAFDALTTLKFRRIGIKRATPALHEKTGMTDTVRGLLLNRKWRGKISGY